MSEESKNEEPQLADLDMVMDRMLPKDGAALKAGPIFERTEFTFPVSGDTCTDGVFYDESGDPQMFKLTVVSLTHQEELDATRSVKAPTDLPFMLAKKSLYKFNGKQLNDKKREFLWEALGPKGRQVVTVAYSEVNAAGDEALGKLHSEWEV